MLAKTGGWLTPEVNTPFGTLPDRIACQYSGPGKWSRKDGLKTMCGRKPSDHCAFRSDVISV
jgi:hypothetical protein